MHSTVSVLGLTKMLASIHWFIEQAGLSLEDPQLYNDTNSTDVLLYEIEIILTELAQNPIALEFEYALAQCFVQIWEDTTFNDDEDGTNNTYTVKELYKLWPYHDWLGVLNGVLGPSGVDIKLSSSVTVRTPEYFRRLTELVENIDNEILENYAKWSMTWQLAEIFVPDTTIRESLILFRQLVLGKPSMDQQQECVQIVEQMLPLALGRVYAQYLLPDGYKEAGVELVAGVRAGLKQRMIDVDWLDDETRKLSIEKLEAIQSRVAYPNMTFNDSFLDMLYGMYKFNKGQYVENYLEFINISLRQQFSLIYKPLDRNMWLDDPTSVNAYYIAVFNQISILEAIMRTPSFSDEWPLSVQYGALGMVLGHELTHGFDNNGRQYDKNGRKRMWWSKEAVDKFKERAQCFVEQYSQYELFGISVNGNQTLGENIADNGGIRASYDAFKKVSHKSEKLPGLTDYSDDQLFFIGFSQLWCLYSTYLSFLISVLTDEHSPGPFRIIGTLSNNELFSEAFECPIVRGSFVAVHLNTSPVTYNETGNSTRFPDETSVAVEDYNYFISDINLQAIPGKLLIGAADTLYLLNPDLTEDTALTLPTSTSNIDTCTASDRSDNPGLACHNHIRVYQRVPGQDILLVCGTCAGVEPRCQGVGISGDGLSATGGDGEVASDGIISYYPEFTQFGDFRNSTDSDPVYLSAGFFPGDSGAGRHFSISYKNITLTMPSDPDTLGTDNLFQTINANNNWLRFPVVFVGAEKADYSPTPSSTGLEEDYQFWFIFLREKLVTDDIIYSRLARVCRNDPGSTSTSNGSPYFTTFMKARIFCERSKPASFDSIHTLNYEYNSITSFVFSQESRYYSNTSPPKRLLYGSFTGPGNGPVGSAICVYPADNSVESSAGAGRTKSVFDIFREDVANDVETTALENTFLECDPEGRPESDQQLLFINPDVSVEQIGDDPILMLENVIVTQMVQDSVCVVTRDTSSTCVNQDVLFLGLDSGHVLKVVFATDENGDIEPVIVEDIELDDENAITKMAKKEDSDRLYVSSWSKIYSLPLHRCSRLHTCSECVGSRDPYCVWSDERLECVQTPLVASDSAAQGTVDDTMFFQNIHTGSATGCNYPEVGFVDMNISVSEGAGSVGIDITASGATFVEVFLESGTATGVNISFSALSYTISEGDSFLNVTVNKVGTTNFIASVTLQSSDGTALGGNDYLMQDLLLAFEPISSSQYIIIPLVNDDVMEADEEFTLTLTVADGTQGVNIASPATASVTITDDDEVTVSLSQSSYVVSEEDGEVTLQLVKSGETELPVEVLLSTVTGTASAPGDFTAVSDRVITFSAQQTSLTTTVNLMDDIIAEDEESFFVSLSIPATQGGVGIGQAQATITVRDRDTVIVRLGSTAYTWSEGDGEVAVVIEKIGSNERVISASLQAEPMTALGKINVTHYLIVIDISGFDYSFRDSLEVQFSSGETQKEVVVVIEDDSVLEDTETFLLSLDIGPGATYDGNSFANITITDDDEVMVQFSSEVCALSVSEDAGSLEVSVARIGLSSIPVTVSVQIQSGTAIVSSDFSGGQEESSLLTIPASPSSTASLEVSILDDEVVETSPEFFSVSISSSQTGVTVAGSDTANISIYDNDYVEISFALTSVTVSEEVGVVSITLLLSGLHSIPVSVSLSTQPLTATADQDFEPITEIVTFEPGVTSRSVSVTIVNDDIREESEEFLVLVSGDDIVMEGSIPQTTVLVVDSDTVQIGFSTSSYSVSEDAGSLEITITRIGLSSIPTTVSVQIRNGTALESSDFSGGQEESSLLTIPASPSSTASLEVSILDDEVVETSPELFSVSISSSQTGVTVAGSDTANISIYDNDYVEISFALSSVTVSEEVGVVSITLLLSGLHSIPVSVSLSTQPLTATADQDFEPITEIVTFEPGVTSRSVSVTIVNDDIREESEEFLVLFSGDDIVMEGSMPQTTVLVVDSDTVQIGFSTPLYSVSESAGLIRIVVEVTGQTDAYFRANISTDSVTATANEDYQPLWTQLVFGPLDTATRELTLQLLDDSVRESTEEFRVQITLDPLNSAGVSVGQDTTSIQIEDDDSVSVSWGAIGYTVSESQSVVELNLVIGGSTSYNSTLLISTLARSATAAQDYVPILGRQLEISPGVALLSVVLDLLDDTEVEALEQFTVTVEPAEGEEQGVMIQQPDTEVFIVSDDVVQVQFLNTTLTVVEGETAELAIFSTATAPFVIALSATLEAGSSQQQSINYLYLLQRTVIIPAGSSNTSLPLYIVPSMGNGTETLVEVVLELVDGTESNSTPRYMSTSTSQTPTPTPPGPPIQPEVGQVTRENSECLYPSQAAAIAITTILALLLALLFSFAALLFLFLRYSHSRHVSKKSSEVCYLPSEESTKGALNHSFENKEEVTSFNESEPATSTTSLTQERVHNEGQKQTTNSTYL
ncbi:Endothelin-converting enzyme 1 [Geodia barretti]|uniref:Endothelin-converting enzyme 1 n=1 Tax=Geodia barretti TaxID=519541 RepID=A0AA35WQ90_GEOBA|nr:Endothelin-converting enzyme 1 [Geodia barretti]